jgi:hypothetical protein
VLGKIRHKFIIRAENEEYAERRAKDLIISENKLTIEEHMFHSMIVTKFDNLDYQGFFVCF